MPNHPYLRETLCPGSYFWVGPGRGTIQGTGRESRNGFRRPSRKRTLIFFSIWFGGLLFLVGRCGRRSWWASHKATPPLTGARRHTSKDTCGLGWAVAMKNDTDPLLKMQYLIIPMVTITGWGGIIIDCWACLKILGPKYPKIFFLWVFNIISKWLYGCSSLFVRVNSKRKSNHTRQDTSGH